MLALPHDVLCVAMEMALVVHDHVEVTFKKGGRYGWIRYVGFVGSLARPISAIVVVFSVEVVHHRVLSVD
jgi:hypothetical protein